MTRDSDRLQRRRLLLLGAAGLSVGLAGCTPSGEGGEEDGGGGEDGEEDGGGGDGEEEEEDGGAYAVNRGRRRQ